MAEGKNRNKRLFCFSSLVSKTTKTKIQEIGKIDIKVRQNI